MPWLDFPAHASATGISGSLREPDFSAGRGGLTALDATTGKVLWQHKLPSMDFGAATVANDVVFTSNYDGTIYAFDTQTGKTLWTTKAPAGINSFPAIDGDTLLVGAGTPGFSRSRSSSSSPTRFSSQPPSRRPAMRTLTIIVLAAVAMAARARPTRLGERRRSAPPQRPPRSKAASSASRSRRSRWRSPGRSRSTSRTPATWPTTSRSTARQTPLIQPGPHGQARRQLQEEGKFSYLCTVPGHAAAGMRGVHGSLTITNTTRRRQ